MLVYTLYNLSVSTTFTPRFIFISSMSSSFISFYLLLHIFFVLFCLFIFYFFFFFQAEDGIRDWSVTGVQTCALPISPRREKSTACRVAPGATRQAVLFSLRGVPRPEESGGGIQIQIPALILASAKQIGRASCRERV